MVARSRGRFVEDIREREGSDGPTTEEGKGEDKRTRSRPSNVLGVGEGRKERTGDGREMKESE